MNLSMASDYGADKGSPAPYLKRIAEARFSHVHWCHHWCTDFMYSDCEIRQIGKWLAEFGLKLLDLHGSVGPEKNWLSAQEYERLAGVELVRNRIEMTARLGGDAVVMHVGGESELIPLRKSLDELQPFAGKRQIRIALENGSFEIIRKILSEYGPGYVGLCYDAGHGNMDAHGLDDLEALKDRLICVHLHDNDGAGDQHRIPFSGTVNWPRLAGIMAGSAYAKCVNLESLIGNSGTSDEEEFLARAHEAARRFAGMLDGNT